MKLLEISE